MYNSIKLDPLQILNKQTDFHRNERFDIAIQNRKHDNNHKQLDKLSATALVNWSCILFLERTRSEV